MKKCPYCGTENAPDAFRCKNEDCMEILPIFEGQNINSDKTSSRLNNTANTNNIKRGWLFKKWLSIILLTILVGACLNIRILFKGVKASDILSFNFFMLILIFILVQIGFGIVLGSVLFILWYLLKGKNETRRE